MRLNGVLLMLIEKYKLDLMNAAFFEKVVDHMSKNEISKSFNVGSQGNNSFIGTWSFEYSLPSIFQKESYDIKCCFEYCGENSETSTNKISHYYFIFSSMKAFFKFVDFSMINKYMKLSDNFYRAVSKYKKVNKFQPINMKVKLGENGNHEIYTTIPFVMLNDDQIVLGSRDILFKDKCFYVMENSNMRKYSIKHFPDYVLDLYTSRIISDINNILGIDLSADNLSHEEAESLIAKYTTVVEMMYT